MNEHDVIRTMKRFPDKINSGKRMMSKKWKCFNCQTEYSFDEEVTVPSPCPECDGISFKTVNS